MLGYLTCTVYSEHVQGTELHYALSQGSSSYTGNVAEDLVMDLLQKATKIYTSSRCIGDIPFHFSATYNKFSGNDSTTLDLSESDLQFLPNSDLMLNISTCDNCSQTASYSFILYSMYSLTFNRRDAGTDSIFSFLGVNLKRTGI
jgi:hypothetical protein